MHNFKFNIGDKVVWRSGKEHVTAGVVSSIVTDMFNNKYVVTTLTKPRIRVTLPEQSMIRGV